MPKTMTVECWVIVSEGEDYAVGVSEEAAVESFENDVSGLGDAGSTRRVKVILTVTVPVPETVTLTGEVPAEGEAELKVS